MQNIQMVSGISVVIPCYRSKGTLPALIDRLEAVLSKLAETYEIILVCDRSPDNTWQLISQLASENPKVRGYELARRRGQQIAVMAGLGMVQYDFVVTIDDDLQQAPEEIEPMLGHLLEHDLDIVIAKLRRKKHGMIRNLGTRMTRRLSRSILQLDKPIKFSSYRVFRRWVSDAAVDLNMPRPVVGYALLSVTDRVANYKIDHAHRPGETRSGYSFSQLAGYFISMMFSYSVLPMRLVSIVGFTGAVLSLIMAAVYFSLALFGVIGGNGFATIIVALSVFFGILMLAIGVLGQYIIFLIKVADGNKLYYIRNTAGEGVNEQHVTVQTEHNSGTERDNRQQVNVALTPSALTENVQSREPDDKLYENTESQRNL